MAYDESTPPMTAPTPSGGSDNVPLSAEFTTRSEELANRLFDISNYALRSNDRTVLALAAMEIRDLAAALLAARRGEAEARAEFDQLVENIIGALRLDADEAEDASNHPLINLPAFANQIANRAALAAAPEEK